jgi:hypothetical protein
LIKKVPDIFEKTEGVSEPLREMFGQLPPVKNGFENGSGFHEVRELQITTTILLLNKSTFQEGIRRLSLKSNGYPPIAGSRARPQDI